MGISDVESTCPHSGSMGSKNEPDLMLLRTVPDGEGIGPIGRRAKEGAPLALVLSSLPCSLPEPPPSSPLLRCSARSPARPERLRPSPSDPSLFRPTHSGPRPPTLSVLPFACCLRSSFPPLARGRFSDAARLALSPGLTSPMSPFAPFLALPLSAEVFCQHHRRQVPHH